MPWTERFLILESNYSAQKLFNFFLIQDLQNSVNLEAFYFYYVAKIHSIQKCLNPIEVRSPETLIQLEIHCKSTLRITKIET